VLGSFFGTAATFAIGGELAFGARTAGTSRYLRFGDELGGMRVVAAERIEVSPIASNTARGPVVRGEGGRFADLDARRVVGDDLTPHHIPQAAQGFTPYSDGGAVVMTTAEHKLTRTYAARGARTARDEADFLFRDVLARDIRDVRNIDGSSYNKGLQDTLDYYRSNYPELMRKGQR
jgi:hypothetical protein